MNTATGPTDDHAREETTPEPDEELEGGGEGTLSFDVVAVRGGVVIPEEVMVAAVEAAVPVVVRHMLVPRPPDTVVGWPELVRVALDAALPTVVASLDVVSS